MEAMILDIQRLSTEDGPGLRTTVFFKGCNLACPWCHNPESISPRPDLNWYSQKCMNCGICRTVCPRGVITWDEGGLRFDRPRCEACGKCAAECPKGAIELKGYRIEVDALREELLKDRAYFGPDGGITLSGGEVMTQREAALALAKGLKAAGVSVAVDTAGCYPFPWLEAMLPYIDIVLYDLKIFDAEAHKRVVRGDNAVILDNYRRLMRRRLICGRTRVWVRTPVIEGATDSAANIEAIGTFLGDAGLPEKWELCAFNNLCRDKYERLDQDWLYKATPLSTRARLEELAALARRFVPSATYSGSVKD